MADSRAGCSDGFVEWLQEYVSRFGVESMVTDDLNTYKRWWKVWEWTTRCVSHTSESGCGIDSGRSMGGIGTSRGYGF